MSDYFGIYEEFQTPSKKDAGQLLGADNMVGDIYAIEDEIIDGEHRAWLVSRFNKRIGFFGPEFSRELMIMAAQGMVCRAILCFVAFTDHPDEGHYWGEAAVICYNQAHSEAFGRFVDRIAEKIGDGVRPAISLEGLSVKEIIDSDGTWLPSQTLPMPDKVKGTAIIKARRTMSDKMIEQGRAGNKGCYAISWLFLLALVALVMFGLYSCFGGGLA